MLDQHSPLLSTMNIFTPCLLIYCVHSPHVWRIKKKGYIGFVSKIIFVCVYFGVRELSKKHIRQQNKNVFSLPPFFSSEKPLSCPPFSDSTFTPVFFNFNRTKSFLFF